MIEVERLVLAGVLVGKTEFLRPGPGLECRFALPQCVRGIERVFLVLGSLEEMKFDEARKHGELRVAVEPHLLECLLGSLLHAKAVHGDEHGPVSCFVGGPDHFVVSVTSLWAQLSTEYRARPTAPPTSPSP